jgi:hypothetical protein
LANTLKKSEYSIHKRPKRCYRMPSFFDRAYVEMQTLDKLAGLSLAEWFHLMFRSVVESYMMFKKKCARAILGTQNYFEELCDSKGVFFFESVTPNISHK